MRECVDKNLLLLVAGVVLLFLLFMLNIFCGAVDVPFVEVFKAIAGESTNEMWRLIVVETSFRGVSFFVCPLRGHKNASFSGRCHQFHHSVHRKASFRGQNSLTAPNERTGSDRSQMVIKGHYGEWLILFHLGNSSLKKLKTYTAP